MPDTERMAIDLPNDFSAPKKAREWIDGLPVSMDDAGDTVRLLVNELVTNSLLHSRSSGPISVAVHVSPARLRVEVQDRGVGFLPGRVPMPAVDSTQGRGLALVRYLSDRWGVGMDGHTKVWFEIDRRQPPLRMES